MNENSSTPTSGSSRLPQKFPPGTPKWVLIVACMVGSVIVPTVLALSPQLSELIKGATEARKAQAENERTALGTVLELVNTNVKQIYVLSAALEAEQQEKKALTGRVTELEKSELMNGRALKDCENKLKVCR